MTQALGRLEPVPLRQVWPHEANDFTPWLADPDNLTMLAGMLNLGDLQVQGTEVPVGNVGLASLCDAREARLAKIGAKGARR